MKRKSLINITVIIGVIVLVIIGTIRNNKWKKKLTSENGQFTVAYVYGKYGAKSKYYEYLYKVDEDYYSASTSGSNTVSFESKPIQCFLVIYDKREPNIHSVIWSYPIDSIPTLGKKIKGITKKIELVTRHTSGMEGLSPFADKNDWDNIYEIVNKLKK